jgi:5-methylcytosine-specific restriction endonuclease McrA
VVIERPELERVQLLLNSLFLGAERQSAGVLGQTPLRWIIEWLGLDPSEHFGEASLRHLVAVQLAPSVAINYDRSNPVPRWKLVDSYLAVRFALPESDRTSLARLVASTLDSGSTTRGPQLVAPESAPACSLCRIPFRGTPQSVVTRDPYKPIWQSPEELLRAEVDHVIPISSLGAHQVQNLQVVCRACNLAKGRGLVIDPNIEIRFAAGPADRVPRIHLFRLLQWLIRRRGGACSSCGGFAGELTMRPVDNEAAIARTTLKLTCYDCLS